MIITTIKKREEVLNRGQQVMRQVANDGAWHQVVAGPCAQVLCVCVSKTLLSPRKKDAAQHSRAPNTIYNLLAKRREE